MRILIKANVPRYIFLLTFLFILFIFIQNTFAETIIKKTGPCTREVINKIELWADTDPKIWSDDDLEDMNEKERKKAKIIMGRHAAYGMAMLEEIAGPWKEEIESVWGGPTKEQIYETARDLDMKEAQLDQATSKYDPDGKKLQKLDNPLRKKLVDHTKNILNNIGGRTDCAYIDCCYIYFKADIKFRKKSDPPRKGYHQVEVIVDDATSGIITRDYKKDVPHHNIESNQKGTKGHIAWRPKGNSPISHEVGHLMGAADTYIKGGGYIPGHRHDLMRRNNGWPHEQAIRDILKTQNAECDCCQKGVYDRHYGTYADAARYARDMVDKCDLRELRKFLQKFQHQKQEATRLRIQWHQKLDLIRRLDDSIEMVKKAIEDCEKKRPITGLGRPYTRTNIFIGSDSPVPCTHMDGNPTSTPLGPDEPEPRDVVPPGGVVPPGEEEEPRDVKPPDEEAEPRDVDPCEELRYLRIFLADLMRRKETPGVSDAELAEIQKNIEKFSRRAVELEEECKKKKKDVDEPEPRDVVPPEEEKEPRDVKPPDEPQVTVYIKATGTVLDSSGIPSRRSVGGQQMKLFPPSTLNIALPGPGVDKPQTDHDKDPIQGRTDDKGDIAFDVPSHMFDFDPKLFMYGFKPDYRINIDATRQGSKNIQLAGTDPETSAVVLPDDLKPYVTDTNQIGPYVFFTVTFPRTQKDKIDNLIGQIPGLISAQENRCGGKQGTPDDPYFQGKSAWQQPYDDQWAIKNVGFTADNDSAWNLIGESPAEVVVAIIDTGLDWNHLDFDWKNLWRNEDEVADNGIDDDNNGYIDDIIGWDFYGRNNRPWDHDGHGTFVAGVIAATKDNGIGIAGINPHARIMVLKALNNFGHTRVSYLAKAIVYAADNGARIINMSVGGRNLTRILKEAINYAYSKGVLIIAAAGNEGIDVSNFWPAGHDNVLTVSSTDLDDKYTVFSNWGPRIDIAAPGIEVLSLRARRTDTMRDIPDVQYVNGANYVGDDKRYYRASGTSFSAPIVAGTASLLLSKNPDLTNEQVKRMILHSAEDIAVPGFDQFTGYGLLDSRAALKADPEFFIETRIRELKAIKKEKEILLEIIGTADADKFKEAWIEIGEEEYPEKWKKVSKTIKTPVIDGVLDAVSAEYFRGAAQWTLRIVAEHENGKKKEARFNLKLQ